MADLNIIDSSGNIFLIPEEKLPAAKAQGFDIATPEQISHYDRVKEAGGFAGGVAAFTGSAANTLSFGAFTPLLEAVAPETAEKLSIAQEANPGLSFGGTVAGIGGSLASPVAKGITALGTKAFDAVAPVAGNVAARAAQFGTEGVAMAAPQAGAELGAAAITGDPEKIQEAGETLMINLAGSAALGGALGSAESGIKSVLKVTQPFRAKAGEVISEKLANKFTTETAKAAGFQKAQLAKMTPDDVSEMSEFFYKEVIEKKGVFQSATNMLNDAETALKEVGPMRTQVTSKLRDAGHFINGDELLKTLEGQRDALGMFEGAKRGRRAYNTKIGELKTLIEDTERHFAIPGRKLDPNKLVPLIDDASDLAWRHGKEIASPVAEHYRKIKMTMDDAILKALDEAEKVNELPLNTRGLLAIPAPPKGSGSAPWEQPLAVDWQKFKYQYRNWSRIENGLNNLVARQGNNTLSLGDLGAGTIGGTLGGVPGAVMAMMFNEAKDNYGSAIASKVIKKALTGAKDVDRYVRDSATRILDNGGRATIQNSKLGAFATLRELSGRDDPDEAVDAVVNHLGNVVSNPNLATERISESMAPYSGLSQQVTLAGHNTAFQAAKVLLELAPKRDRVSSPFESKRGGYTNGQMADFERQVAAAINPLSVLDDMANNAIDPGTVTVLQKVFPVIYKQMKRIMLEEAGNKPRDYTYGQKLNLSIFFGSEVDSMGEPRYVRALQQSYVKKEEPKPKNIKGKISDGSMTTAQKIESR